MGRTEIMEGFDWAWSVLPEISFYQLAIAIVAGYPAFIAGMTAVYPVFAQAQPESRCPTELDVAPYSELDLSFEQHLNVSGVWNGEVFEGCQYWNKTGDMASVWEITHDKTQFMKQMQS